MCDRKLLVLSSLQQALLGEVSPNLRAVTVVWDEESIHFECFFDGEVGESDIESMSYVETKLMAVFPESHNTTSELIRLDYPSPIPKDRCWAYYRKEA
jgi:hypothetical protein